MAVNVRIPDVLRKLTNGSDNVTLEAGTVKEMLDALEKAHPGIKERICDEQGNVRRFINIFVNEEDIRFDDNLNTKLAANADVSECSALMGIQPMPPWPEELLFVLAKDIGAEAFYFDPVWDTFEGSSVWDEARLGTLADSTPLLRDLPALRRQMQDEGYVYLPR